MQVNELPHKPGEFGMDAFVYIGVADEDATPAGPRLPVPVSGRESSRTTRKRPASSSPSRPKKVLCSVGVSAVRFSAAFGAVPSVVSDYGPKVDSAVVVHGMF